MRLSLRRVEQVDVDSNFLAIETAFNSLGLFAGTGTPEGNVTAGVGAQYRRFDGGAGTSFYVKESGTGNTGWVGK